MSDANSPSLDGIEDIELDELSASDLSETQARFVRFFMQHGQAARAAKEAGIVPPDWRPTEAARVMMQDPEVAAVIRGMRRGRLARLRISAERIEEELAKIAFANIGRFLTIQDDGTPYYDLCHATSDDLAAIASVRMQVADKRVDDDTVKVLNISIDMLPKIQALGQLARIRKMVGADVAVASTDDVARLIREARARAGMKE